MLDEQIADKMAGAGGVGMAEMFARQLAPQDAPQDALGAHAITAAHGARAITESYAAPEFAVDHPPGAPAFALPVAGQATSGFGARFDPIQDKQIQHPGFDLAAPVGTPVAAAAGGTVTHAGPAGTYGNLITIRHGDGFETRYAHLSAVDVHVGDPIETGQPIGKVGTTGYSTGPHLHFEVRHDGKPVDPAPYLPLNRSNSRANR
jgi:murein DD-endopeptidase MepM/ murein hydrolase activator NlpD